MEAQNGTLRVPFLHLEFGASVALCYSLDANAILCYITNISVRIDNTMVKEGGDMFNK